METRSDHSEQLKNIDLQQRQEEQKRPHAEDHAFDKPVIEALQPKENSTAPLLSQEELDDEQPRINWTAVICTAIVVTAATIILIVAKPWDNHGSEEQPLVAMTDTTVATRSDVPTVPAAVDTPKVAPQPEPAPEPEPEPEIKPEPKPEVEPAPQPKLEQSSLPVVAVTTTGTENSYNKLRLIDASSRKLTSGEVSRMSKAELSLARNAIYARHGYTFNNAELREFFTAQRWFKASGIDINDIQLTETELSNIKLIQARENELNKR